MQSVPQEATRLARRLRQLREQEWEDAPLLTQAKLAKALSAEEPLTAGTRCHPGKQQDAEAPSGTSIAGLCSLFRYATIHRDAVVSQAAAARRTQPRRASQVRGTPNGAARPQEQAGARAACGRLRSRPEVVAFQRGAYYALLRGAPSRPERTAGRSERPQLYRAAKIRRHRFPDGTARSHSGRESAAADPPAFQDSH